MVSRHPHSDSSTLQDLPEKARHKGEPAYVFTGLHVVEAFKHIRQARALLIDNLPKIGVEIEHRWQEIVEKTPHEEERSDASSVFDGKEQAKKHDAVYRLMVEEGDSRCAPIEKLYAMCDSELARLSPRTHNNPFRALDNDDLKTAEEFCRQARLYAAGENGKIVPGFKANPRRAVTEAVKASLEKFRRDIDAETMHAIPDTITRELHIASREIGEAIASIEKKPLGRKARDNPR